MAVSFSTHASASPVTTTNIAISLTVGGTNPALVQIIGIADDTATVTSLSWTLGSGTTVQITSVAGSTIAVGSPFARTAAWAIPAPGAGAGTARAGFSASVPIQSDLLLFIGADQTTPCPATDVNASWTGAADYATTSLTAPNLTANDAICGGCVNSVASDPTSITPTQTYLNNGTACNLMAGYGIGNTTMVFTWVDNNGNKSAVAVRVAAAAASGGVSQPIMAYGDLSGIGSPGRFFKDPLQ